MDIKRWYRHGLWDKGQVAEAVQLGELSEADYEEITGEGYSGEISAQAALLEIAEVLG